MLSSHLPGEGSLQFYASKSDVRRSPSLFVENVTDIMDVSHMGYNKKQRILQLTFSDHLIFLQFSSAATMQQWNSKLKDFLSEYSWFHTLESLYIVGIVPILCVSVQRKIVS